MLDFSSWQGAGSPPAPASRSWFQGGRPLNVGETSQGGGAPIGGGIGGGPNLVTSGDWGSQHRGMLGGVGVRTGGNG